MVMLVLSFVLSAFVCGEDCSDLSAAFSGQLEPIDDWSMCDTESCQQPCPAKMRSLWRHHKQGGWLVKAFDEAVAMAAEQVFKLSANGGAFAVCLLLLAC